MTKLIFREGNLRLKFFGRFRGQQVTFRLSASNLHRFDTSTRYQEPITENPEFVTASSEARVMAGTGHEKNTLKI